MPIDAFSVLCAQLTRDLLAIAKFLFFSAKGGPIWIKFLRLVQNDMLTAVMWSKSKLDVEFQYGGRLEEFNGMSSSQSHVSHCRVLPYLVNLLSRFQSHMPHCRVQSPGRNQCHDRATMQSVRISSTVLKIVFRHILFYFCFNAV